MSAATQLVVGGTIGMVLVGFLGYSLIRKGFKIRKYPALYRAGRNLRVADHLQQGIGQCNSCREHGCPKIEGKGGNPCIADRNAFVYL